MAGFLYKGILLQQHKEPALSRDLREFVNADTIGVTMNRSPVENAGTLSPDGIVSLAREAHIVDERDGKPLADKLERFRARTVRLLIADAIDDEPYLSSQLGPLLKNPAHAAAGLRLAQRAAGADEAQFAVYKNLTDLDVRIPHKIEDFPVRRIRGRYPAEYQAAQTFEAAEDVEMIGVGALIQLARAALFNRPQTTAFITVAGDCIGNPTNLEVSLGMTVAQVLERCGLIDDPARVVVGGSMTGISVIDTDNTLVTPSTRAVLAFREDFKSLGFDCIGCSRCVHVCPKGLNPFFLYRAVRQRRYHTFRTLDAQMCIGCGTCSYMCPARLDLSETIQRAAREFRPMGGAIRVSSALLAKKDAADSESYLADYALHRAGITHRRALAAQLRAYQKRCREIGAAHASADRAADEALARALAAHREAEASADRALARALSSRQTAEHAADEALALASRQKQASEQAADEALARAMNRKQETEAAADKSAADALRARGEAQQAAEKASAAARKHAQAAGREADKALAAALKAQERAEKDAAKALAKAQRNAALPEEEKQAAQRALDDLQKNAGAVRAEAEAACEAAKARAQADCDAADETGARAVEAAKAAHEAAKAAAVEAKASALERYEAAQETCKEDKIAAGKALEAARQRYDELKAAALEAYETAQAADEETRAAALETCQTAQREHVRAKEAALAAYEAENAAAQADDEARRAEIEEALARAKAAAAEAEAVLLRAEAAFEGRAQPEARVVLGGPDVSVPAGPEAADAAEAADAPEEAAPAGGDLAELVTAPPAHPAPTAFSGEADAFEARVFSPDPPEDGGDKPPALAGAAKGPLRGWRKNDSNKEGEDDR